MGFLALFLVCVAFGFCVACPAGTFESSSGCEPCSIGTFMAFPGSSTCFSCMSGTFSNSTGSSHCDRCTVGQFVGASGADRCEPCRAGSFQYTTGGTACIPCVPGSFQSNAGATACASCPAGSIQGDQGMPLCETCPPGSFSWAAGGSVCLSCGRGMYQGGKGATHCEDCTPGSFQDEPGGSACQTCDAGWFQAGRGASGCVACGPGMFQSVSGASSCDICPAGTFQPSPGQQDNASCVECPAGSYSSEPGSSRCRPCAPGSFQGGPGGLACIRCPPGAYQLVPGGVECVKCPPGTAGSDRPTEQCPYCPAGHYAPEAGLSACVGCARGSFQSKYGATFCNSCSSGTYLDRFGGEECIACRPGTFSGAVGATTNATCMSCAKGYYSPGLGQTSENACAPCPRGTFPAPDQSECLVCPVATFCPEAASEPVRCLERLRCNGTHVDAGPGLLPFVQANCAGAIPCPRGTLCAEGGVDKGVLAFPGRDPYFVVFLGGNLLGESGCGGFYHGYERIDPLVDEPVEGIFYLQPRVCPTGTFLEDEECEPCPVGTSSSGPGALFVSSCRPCGAGTYSPSLGGTVCLACGRGAFQEEEGASGCDPCPVGMHQADEGMAWCDPCLMGSFSPSRGQSDCTTCPADTIQAGVGRTDCVPCNGSLEFSSPGDSRCRRCGVAPDALEETPGCDPVQLPATQEAIWVEVRGVKGDECARTKGGSVRFFEGARCQHTLMVLGRPELGSTWIDPPTSEEVQNITRLRIVPYDQKINLALCRQHGFGFLFVPLTADGLPASRFPRLQATFRATDLSGKHLLFQGGCQAPDRMGACHTRSFCPSTEIMVRVTLDSDAGVQGVATLAVEDGLSCPPVVSWTASFHLHDPFPPRTPGTVMQFRIDLLNPPAAVLAFRFTLKIRPGFSFVAFDGGGQQHLAGGMLSVEGEFPITGNLTLRLDAEHHGVLRAFRVDRFQAMLGDGGWLSVAVQTDCFTCRRDGFAEVLTDYSRVTSLVVVTERPWLVHWRAVQSDADQFSFGVSVLAVRNDALGAAHVEARCRSLSPKILSVVSCGDIKAVGSGIGVLGVDFAGQVSRTHIPVITPSVTSVRVIPDASGRLGRIEVLASVKGFEVDITPFVVRPGMTVSQGGVVMPEGMLHCLPDFNGNISLGRPVLLTHPCHPPRVDPPETVFLLSGDWTSGGIFKLGASTLTPASDVAGLVFFRGDRVSSASNYVVSRDPGRAVVGTDGRLRLVRHGLSPRCVTLRDDKGGRWGVRVLPPAPTALHVELTRTVLVVQQDLWKLVPSQAGLAVASLRFSDGSSVDVAGDPRLTWITTSSRLELGPSVVRALASAGEASVSFGFQGISCVGANVSIRIFESSVVSGELLCPSCPAVLAVWDDPLGSLGFPVAIPAGLFVQRRLLVDGTLHESPAVLDVRGGRETPDALVVADTPGVLTVSTSLSPERIDVSVVRRWAVGADLLCNGRACGRGLRLTLPGDAAALAPFYYADRLELGLELELCNGSSRLFPWLPGVSLTINETATAPSSVIALAPGEARLLVVFGPEWGLGDPTLTKVLRVVVLGELTLDVSPILYQLHCSRLWEISHVIVRAALTDGTSSVVKADLAADGVVLGLDAASVLWVERPGEGRVNASFGGAWVTQEVLATPASRLFTGLSLDSIPSSLEVPVGTRTPILPVLSPSLLSRAPEQLLERVVRWTVSQEGVVDVDGGGLTLLSDYHGVLDVAGVIRTCQGAEPVVVHRSVQVNVVPDKPGQIDFGDEHGPPLPVVAVEGRLAIPVFVFAPEPLLGFRGRLSLPGVDELACLPGELPFSQCVVQAGFAEVSGDFPVSQRVGRLLIGVLSGRVLLNTLARLHVSLETALVGSLGDVGNTTALFTVRLGDRPTRSVLSPLNEVGPGVRPGGPDLSGPFPSGMASCCRLLVTGEGSLLEKWVPSAFRIEAITLLLSPDASKNISLLDPRIQVFYDDLVLGVDGSGGWRVRAGSESEKDSTEILLRYVHPLTLGTLQTTISVVLARAEALAFRPAALDLRRIHCSSRFQGGDVGVELVLRGGEGAIPVDGGESFLEDPGVAFLEYPGSGVRVTGSAPGRTRLILRAFGLEGVSSVTVRDESVRVQALRLADPYVLSLPWMGVERLRAVGVLEGGEELADVAFLDPLVESNGSVAVRGALLTAQGNTYPGVGGVIRVVLSGCGADVSAVSCLRVILAANLSGHQRADVLVEAELDGFTLSLVAPLATVFFVQLFARGVGSCRVIEAGGLVLGDCALSREGLVLAGVLARPLGPSPVRLATVAPMPATIHGVVEVYAGVSSSRNPIVAGRFGDPGDPQGLGAPVVDTATLDRSYRRALEAPWEPSGMERVRFELGLLTGRNRVVDTRVYSNDNELSVMFRVTDRYLRPDVNQTTIFAVVRGDSVPAHPLGERTVDGAIRVLAQHVVDGWYAAQWLDRIPQQRLRVAYEASTTTSLAPWNSTVCTNLVAGRPLHACPRFATDTASFRLVYEFAHGVPGDLARRIACAARVAMRRVTVGGPYGRGRFTVFVDVESFIRIQQVHAAIMNFSSQAQEVKGRRLLQMQGMQRVALLYINDTVNDTAACPLGFYFSSNGTYERLPQHGVAGLDCYDMSCLLGYTLLDGDCVPSAVSLDVIWICVIVVLGVVGVVSCVLCAMQLGRSDVKPAPVDLTSEQPWPEVMGTGQFTDEEFFDGEFGFRNIVVGSYLDEYSKDMLDDFIDPPAPNSPPFASGRAS